MKKLIAYTLGFCLLILTSCGTSKLETGIKHIKLGMTQNEVRNILGNNYLIMGAGATPDGDMETWSYADSHVLESSNKKIIINFNNGRLVEWHREYIPVAPTNNNPDKEHHHD